MIDDCPKEKVREVPASEILEEILNENDIDYDCVIIKGDLDLSKLHLPTQHIERTNFENQLKFSEEAKLVKSKIKITKSKIDGILFFGNTVFSKAIAFSETVFVKEANFSGSLFSGNADFHESQFSKTANFSESLFSGLAKFTDAQFSGYADFWHTRLGGSAIFYGDRFSDYADFFGAQFSGDVDFDWAQFSGDAIFYEAEFSKPLSMNMTKYDRLLIHWESIKEHLKYDSATYLLLIKNFRNLGLFGDADACYYQYRKESQSRKFWYNGPKRPFVWIHRFNWSKMWDHLSWISCGYGLKIWPMIVWIIGAILIFAYVYNAYNGIAKDIGNTSPIDSLYFSTFALAGRTPPDTIHSIGIWKYVTLLENLLGYVFLALFVVVLGRKVVR